MELFKIIGKIAVDAADAIKSLKDTSEAAEGTSSKIGTALNGIGKGAAAVGKAAVVGIGAAATAVGGLVGVAINSYAEYEQLVGGVDTLFAESSAKVQQYAENAYKTAGMSANEYMETVTSFSATLLQGLDGNTELAAEVANKAITDMSDNANKMGTDIGMIQNAYNGFAKQNYTMLDNLKLGYGGTQAEMARLINDSGVLGDSMTVTAETVNQVSFDKIIEAIGVVQDELGITGTTAKEASSTISGSIASMKSSWQNLLTAISSDDLPFDDYVDNFVTSVSTVAENLMPRIEIALNGVVKLIDKLAPIIIAKLPELLSTLLPAIITTATSLLNSLVAILPSLIDMLVNTALPQLLTGLITIFNAIVLALPDIVQMIVAALPVLIPQLVTGLVSMIVTLASVLPQIIQPIIDYLPQIIVITVETLLQNLPVLLMGIGQLIVGIVRAIPQLLSSLWQSITTLASNFANKLFTSIEGWIRQLFPKSADTVLQILRMIQNYFSVMVSNIKQILSVVVTVISTPFKLAWNGVKLVWNNCTAFFRMIWENIKSIFSVVDSVLSGDFRGAWNGIKSIWSNVAGFFKQIVTNIKNAFSNVAEILKAPFEKGKAAVSKIVENIKGLFDFEFKLPNIKTPKFSISPSGWKIGDLLDGSIPKLGISWNAAAMNNPMIMTKPTIFGYNGATGELLGGGEAGAEVVSGASTLMRMIQAAVSNESGATQYYLERILAIMADFFPQFIEALHMELRTDTGALVGELVVPMDKALGELQIKKGRGR